MELDITWEFPTWSVRARVRQNEPDQVELDFTPNNPKLMATELETLRAFIHKISAIMNEGV